MQLAKLKEFIKDGQIPEFSAFGANNYLEDVSIPVDHRTCLSGHVYTFKSISQIGVTLSVDEWFETSKSEYLDKQPIFISLGQEGPMEIGLNLKVMPTRLTEELVRSYLKIITPMLDKIVNSDGNFIDLAERIKLPANYSLSRLVNRDFFSKYEYFIDKYRREDMSYLTLIDWKDVPKLAKINYSNNIIRKL
jgi:hypothetical protein